MTKPKSKIANQEGQDSKPSKKFMTNQTNLCFQEKQVPQIEMNTLVYRNYFLMHEIFQNN